MTGFSSLGCEIDPSPDTDSLAQPVVACAAGPTVEGIDVSKYQGTIAWDQVAAAGVRFAFIRTSDGLGYVDARFAANWQGARAAGVLRGSYQFYEPGQDPVAQADLMLQMMGPLAPGDLPPVIDVEVHGSNPAAYVAGVHAWVDRVRGALGVAPIVYTGKWIWQGDLAGTGDFLDLPLWLAAYVAGCPDTPSPYPGWDFWQYSSTGHIAGISGAVDRDVFNGDLAALTSLTVGGATCGDGTCDGGETVASCAVDCACQLLDAAGGVVDDTSLCFTAGGDPRWLYASDLGWDQGLVWTHATSAPAADNFGQWELVLAAAGRYRVEAYVAAGTASVRHATYAITHGGAVDSFTIDQAAAAGWVPLAELDFAAGGDQRIRLGDNTGESFTLRHKLVFDAIRLVPTAAPPQPEPGALAQAPLGDDGAAASAAPAGCATTGSGAGSGGLLVLAALLGVRAGRSSRRR